MEIKVNTGSGIKKNDEYLERTRIEKFAPSAESKTERVFASKIEPKRNAFVSEIKKEVSGKEKKGFLHFFGNISDKIIGLSIFMIFFGVPLF